LRVRSAARARGRGRPQAAGLLDRRAAAQPARGRARGGPHGHLLHERRRGDRPHGLARAPRAARARGHVRDRLRRRPAGVAQPHPADDGAPGRRGHGHARRRARARGGQRRPPRRAARAGAGRVDRARVDRAAEAGMSEVSFRGIEKRFDAQSLALRSLDLDVPDGAFLVLLGPSGCGKTTALRVLAGLETPTAGTVHIGDRDVTRIQPRDRDVAMVFQSYALYPHMTVGENIGYPLRIRGLSKADQRAGVQRVAESLEIAHLLDRRPRHLSGGQRQRVALARAIVREPSVFLMDEPLSNLDAKLRTSMRGEIKRLQKRLGTTTLYVTHDQAEAMTMADLVAVMREGQLQQLAPPEEI